MKDIALMGHIVACFPDFEKSLDAALGIALGGAKYLEIQFPFSDPNADGIAIANACEVALKGGFNTDIGFTFLKTLQERFHKHNCDTKLLIMTYGNIVFNYGIKDFLKEAKKCGIFGLIVPDLSLQNDENLFKLSRKFKLENIALIAPTTPQKRIKLLVKQSGKLLYVVARNGITGDSTSINRSLVEYVESIRKHCKKPIALGFGIQTKEQIQTLRGIVPIVVVGSAFVRKIKSLCEMAKQPCITQELQDFTKELLS